MYRYPLTSPHYGLMPTHIFSSSSSSELDTVSNVGYRSDESGTTVDINDVGEELNKTLQLSFEVRF